MEQSKNHNPSGSARPHSDLYKWEFLRNQLRAMIRGEKPTVIDDGNDRAGRVELDSLEVFRSGYFFGLNTVLETMGCADLLFKEKKERENDGGTVTQS